MQLFSIISIFLLLLLPISIESKTLGGPFGPVKIPKTKQSSLNATVQINRAESAVKDFLNWRAGKGAARPSLTEPISEHEYLSIIKKLSKQSTALAKSLLSIEGDSVFLSNGGHFEIRYFEKGQNAVNTTDLYGYDKSNWRIRIDQKNGVPDYIDEVGWALDSCWSMEVDRFKLVRPLSISSGPQKTDRYIVVVEAQMSSYYGLTYVGTKLDTENGYTSHMSIRNEWSGDEWAELGYQTHPENGIRVTCAHEFFHAIQYAMTRNVVGDINLDDFPLSWLEGSATSMEDLAFPYINDYIQYSDIFFSNPSMSFLSDKNDSYLYTNALPLLYFYKIFRGVSELPFTAEVFRYNFQQPVPFEQNIQNAAKMLGTNWTDMLNSFHVSSYFSGIRADTNRFINDASLFRPWSYTRSKSSTFIPIQKNINPNGMGIFSYESAESPNDTLRIHLENTSSIYQVNSNIAASLILKKNDYDSLVKINPDTNGSKLVFINNWKSWNEVILIVTNADMSKALNYTVTFDNCSQTHSSGENLTITKVSIDSNSTAKLEVSADSNLYCIATLAQNFQKQYVDSARSQRLVFYSGVFDLNIPVTWESNANLSFSIMSKTISDEDNGSIYCWNETQSQWISVSSVQTTSSAGLVFSTHFFDAKLYAIMGKAKGEKTARIPVYPNPVSLHKGSPYVTIGSKFIYSIDIYGVDGTLVYQSKKSQTSQTGYAEYPQNIWYLKNKNNKFVIPGLYHAIIKYGTDNTYSKIETTQRKIIVTP